MPIDLKREKALSVARAARYASELLGREEALSSATLHRWIRKGKFGIRLESLNTPSGRLVTIEAIHRFFEALTVAARRERTAVQRGERNPGVGERVEQALESLPK